jgi:hypothetical protein
MQKNKNKKKEKRREEKVLSLKVISKKKTKY